MNQQKEGKAFEVEGGSDQDRHEENDEEGREEREELM